MSNKPGRQGGRAERRTISGPAGRMKQKDGGIELHDSRAKSLFGLACSGGRVCEGQLFSYQVPSDENECNARKIEIGKI